MSEIALFYKDLTTVELSELKRLNLVVQQTDATVIGRFNKEGIAVFPDKVTAVYTLSA